MTLRRLLRTVLIVLRTPFAWVVVLDTGKTVYERNRSTGARRAWQRFPGEGYQPIDRNWVDTGRWSSGAFSFMPASRTRRPA